MSIFYEPRPISVKTFVVLGMHRSATSLIAKSLDHEIHMGTRFIKPDEHNPLGYFENFSFYKLNMEILERAGGDWQNPPSESEIMKQKSFFDFKIKQLIEQSEKPLWGWKDPRTVLTINLFEPYLRNPHYICCFRNPIEVAKSLVARNDMSFDKGIALAKEYNSRIIKFMSKKHEESW